MADDADAPGRQLGVQLLVASRALTDEVHRRLAAGGHERLRPAHRFLFQALGPDGATASEIAGHLAITKQAARLVVEELIALGYVARGVDPEDRRRRPVWLTGRGEDALRRSETIFEELRGELEHELGPKGMAAGLELLEAIDRSYGPAPLRPVW